MMVITRLFDKKWVNLHVVGARLDLTLDGYTPLAIERVGEDRVQIYHRYEENGDVVPDPMMTFVINELGWIPIDKTEPYTGFKSVGYVDADTGEVTVTNVALQYEFAEEADKWAELIEQRDWMNKAAVQISGPEECRIDPMDIPF